VNASAKVRKEEFALIEKFFKRRLKTRGQCQLKPDPVSSMGEAGHTAGGRLRDLD